MAGASIEIKGFDELEKLLGQAVRHLSNTQLLAKSIGESMVSSTKQRFDEGKGPDGKEWKKSARVEAEGGETLRETSRLRNSIHYEATSDSVDWGTIDKRATIHQFGGKIKAKSAKALCFQIGGEYRIVKAVTMPARPFLGINDEDKEEIKDQAAVFVARGLGK